MKKNKKDIYYCFRYKCKNCPKNRICEEGDKSGEKRSTNRQQKNSRSNS